MIATLFREIRGFNANINNGLRLLYFKPVPLEAFYISFDQIILLLLFYAAITFGGSFYLSLPKPEWSPYGFISIATHLFFILQAVYLLSKLMRKGDIKLPLLIVMLSVWPWVYLTWLILGENSNFYYWEFFGDNNYLYLFYNIWFLFVLIRAFSCIIRVSAKNTILLVTTLVGLVFVPLHYLAGGDFWYRAYDDDQAYDSYHRINTENTYYKQFGLIENAKTTLLPERKHTSDIYFIGFGGDATQDVFMKEVQYARRLLDDRFDTQGRSVALINNRKTMDACPLATQNNLHLVIQHIGGLLNAEEDILFLYLTSHGSKHQKLAVEFGPLGLNAVEPQSLKDCLNRSGIKYSVLIVSACYSGAFIEPLKDDNTLILTSAAPDKTSFGCSNESDFTYLGRAIFEEQLTHNFDFIDAFNKAIASVHRRENTQGYEHSEPQLFVGKTIRTKLEEIAQGLETVNSLGWNL